MTRQFVRTSLLAATVAIIAGVVACGGSSDNPAGPSGTAGTSTPGGSGGPTPPTPQGKGKLTLAMTDSPFSEADAVLVSFDGVSIHRAESNGWEPLTLVTSPRVCDLKKLQGPVDVLGVAEPPAGHYTQIRLSVVEASIYFGTGPSTGEACAAIAPAGQPDPVQISSGEIKLNRQFTLEAGSNMKIVLDFDGDKSIHKAGGGGSSKVKYIMNPVIGIASVGVVQ